TRAVTPPLHAALPILGARARHAAPRQAPRQARNRAAEPAAREAQAHVVWAQVREAAAPDRAAGTRTGRGLHQRRPAPGKGGGSRSEEHTSELQSRENL